MIAEGKAEEAWQLLAPYEPRQAGHAEYDYVFGIAALESGRLGRATFILERVLVRIPGHTAARLEMARAYFALGDRERAAREFRAVLAAAPTAQARAVAESYLERLDGSPRAGARTAAYVEAAVGRDSNANAAVSAGNLLVALPLTARQPDAFVAVAAGASLQRPIDGTYSLFAGAEFRQRMHDDLGAFDSRVADVRAGVQMRLDERDRVRFSLEHESYDLDRASLRRTHGAAAQWIRRLAPDTEASAFVQALRTRYREQSFSRESSDLFLAGARGARAFGSFVAAATLYAGQDDATAGRADGDRVLLGLTAALERRVDARLDVDAQLTYQRSDYSSDREDRYVGLSLGLSWHIAPDWLLRPEISRTSNRSNMPLTEYGRTEVSVGLRRTWD